MAGDLVHLWIVFDLAIVVDDHLTLFGCGFIPVEVALGDARGNDVGLCRGVHVFLQFAVDAFECVATETPDC